MVILVFGESFTVVSGSLAILANFLKAVLKEVFLFILC